MTRFKSTDKEMSFLDHLEDLRWHLIRSFLSVIILASIAFLAKDFIFNVLIFGPKHSDFPTYKILCEIAQFIGFKDSFCFTELPFRIQSRTMGGQFSAHVWTSITAGFIIAFPYILNEMWKFISPGLKTNERSSAKGFILKASLLFFIGVLFGYYVVTPLSINFLGTYQVSGEVYNDFDLSSYISLVRASVIASGLIFELPILIYILTKVGIVSPEILKKYRKLSLVIVLILSAIITPPDIASQVIVSVPIIVLYEISIYISKAVIRKQKRLFKKQAKNK
ncbi:MAG: twin-arginine translocase subunit TatC [Flavobacteriales bacterium]|nr:MAG: twin-arginine translocase subunit TatC [Flavobacteriales bacterium]